MKDFRVFNKRNYLILLSVLFIILGLDYKIQSNLVTPKVLGEDISVVSSYPILKININPDVSAQGIVIMDADSKAVLFSKNPNLRFSSASTTKIMTAITALGHFNLNDVLTVKQATSEGVVLGLKQGEKITFENLLYALLLPSANDTAFTIAQNYSSQDDFVKEMNKNAAKFNLYNTHYQDPAGLEDDGDYTTPFDLARLASIAMQNEEFAKVVSTKEKIVTDVDGNLFPVKSLNKLLGTGGVIGVKTGYTEGAGQVLVTAKKEGDHKIIIVVMGSSDRFSDTQKLLDIVSGNITYLPIHP